MRGVSLCSLSSLDFMIVAHCDISAKSPAFATNSLSQFFANHAFLLRQRALQRFAITCQSYFAACSMGTLA